MNIRDEIAQSKHDSVLQSFFVATYRSKSASYCGGGDGICGGWIRGGRIYGDGICGGRIHGGRICG